MSTRPTQPARLLPNLRYADERLSEEELLGDGTVYLIHLSKPFGHMRHYIGWSSQLKRRIWHHRNGTGAHVLKLAVAVGCRLKLVRTWEDTSRLFERYLKKRRESAAFCPVCREARQKRRNRLARQRRRAPNANGASHQVKCDAPRANGQPATTKQPANLDRGQNTRALLAAQLQNKHEGANNDHDQRI